MVPGSPAVDGDGKKDGTDGVAAHFNHTPQDQNDELKTTQRLPKDCPPTLDLHVGGGRGLCSWSEI